MIHHNATPKRIQLMQEKLAQLDIHDINIVQINEKRPSQMVHLALDSQVIMQSYGKHEKWPRIFAFRSLQAALEEYDYTELPAAMRAGAFIGYAIAHESGQERLDDAYYSMSLHESM